MATSLLQALWAHTEDSRERQGFLSFALWHGDCKRLPLSIIFSKIQLKKEQILLLLYVYKTEYGEGDGINQEQR